MRPHDIVARLAAPSRSSQINLSPAQRLAAWLITGPVGHFAAGAADWFQLMARWGWARARGRDYGP